jgi:hypothetical protein
MMVNLNRYGAPKQFDSHHNAQRLLYADAHACQASQRRDWVANTSQDKNVVTKLSEYRHLKQS